MLTSREIRQQFIDFFVKRHGHTYVPSSPVTPHDDPTLLFANAGMNQFKDVFLATGTREYSRAVNTQKCIRAGGKHNDLDDVGKDTYHHTFFEMLGNWSFGDYFKTEAIDWAWELLAEVWKVDPSRLHATYFEGDKAQGLEPDIEARDLWLKHLPAEQVHPGALDDNFWEMGETGPCGPCTELHVDLTPDKSGGSLVNAGDARVIEIWNLVFIQYNREINGSLSPLPARHVDTGMGFERLCAVLQGKTSNYDSDVFTPLFDAIEHLSGAEPYGGRLNHPADTAYRVIADHIRALTFAIADGAMPGPDGRGYVLRRILRRAVRYGRQHLKFDQPFMHQLVDTVIEQMGDAFPEIRNSQDHIAGTILEEEESFSRTLDRGIELFEIAASRAGTTLTAEDAFNLYDTFGFPIDLTQLMAEERGMTVDIDGFETLMAEARRRSRADGGSGDDAKESLISLLQKHPMPATDFIGYETNVADSAHVLQLLAMTHGAYAPASTLNLGQRAAVVTDVTPFYAESGGQVGDVGRIHSRHGAVFEVTDTQRLGNVMFHIGELDSGNIHREEPAFSSEDELLMEVEPARRQQIKQHHTATHLMNWALREVLGDHVQQKGSLVDDEKTRFDFSHGKPLTPEQIEQIQTLVREQIDQEYEVYTAVVDQHDALQINGLRAVFGEKYPPKVRVVSIGAPVNKLLKHPQDKDWRDYSIEFCGGTHLQHTGEVRKFVILHEEGVAKGIRRVTAVAGELAARAEQHAEVLSGRIEAMGQQSTPSLEQDIASLAELMQAVLLPSNERGYLRDRLAELQKIVKKEQKKSQLESESSIVDAARALTTSSDRFIISAVEGADANSLRKAMDVIRKSRPDAAMMLAAVSDGKVAFLAAVPPALIEQGLKAGDWVREVAQVAGGGGGGRPDMAQAGGKNPAKLHDALVTARKFAEETLGLAAGK